LHLSFSQRPPLPSLRDRRQPQLLPGSRAAPGESARPAEIASTLTANLDDFTSAAQINDFLSRLLLLLAQDKISTRRAAVLAYITNQLLRTLPAIAKEENAEPTSFIFDAPRPERDLPETTPGPQHQESQEPQGAGTNGRAPA
jgi:hypothetical protein